MLNRWIPATFIAVAVALALAGGAVLANGGAKNDQRSKLFERTAQILGIDQSDLENAHDQAKREANNERLVSVAAQMVAKNLITQAEADDFKLWIDSRPDAVDVTLFTKLTSTVFNKSTRPKVKIKIKKFGLGNNDDVTDRMATILGIDPQELADAMKDGAAQVGKLTRLETMHDAVNALLESGKITSDEGSAIHPWIDDVPKWLLELDIYSHLPADQGKPSGKLPKPWKFSPWHSKGDDHKKRGNKFELEFTWPDSTSRLNPEDNRPFEKGRFGDFGLDGLEGLEDLEDFKQWFERFHQHEFFTPPFKEPVNPSSMPKESTSDA